MTAQISVKPNPFTNVLQIQIKGDESDFTHYIIRFINEKGNILRMIGISLVEGNNKILIDRLQILSSGNYFLDIKNTEGEVVFSTKLVKE